MSTISIIGMACRYAGACSPRQLWENVLAQRRSFRRIPAVRLRIEDYSPEDQGEDGIYLRTAAVLEDYDFDRVRFRVSKETFDSTDLSHWLALDVAWQALEDAKLLDATDRQRERIGVYIGNSLTGEFSRANLLRLRWPYVRRVLATALTHNGRDQNGDLRKLLMEIGSLYKAPFPATTEESLAGGLSNTIAGRICNYFNFKGGGYIVDGACASSLLAVSTACAALETGDIDVAIAGGVDLSLDPFELAGFSKLGALAYDNMRVFDAHATGFWPGEGCGMLVLMRYDEAAAQQRSSYAVVRGWGISSDGSGGITRPEAAGQLLSLRRAYQRAGYGVDSVHYFEGHGTGTLVGDAAELQALLLARQEAGSDAAPGALGSIKANIGHTKAAAGVAGLIKATMAVHAKILPPTTGCDTPHPLLQTEKPMLRVLQEGELWPDGKAVRAGVSSMGFGGINTHITLEATHTLARKTFTVFEQKQLRSVQDCELFLFKAPNAGELANQLEEMLELAAEMSFAEMTDAAAALVEGMTNGPRENGIRAACVASSPDELERRVRTLREWCESGADRFDSAQGLFLGRGVLSPRIAFMFPGQGSPVHTSGGIWSRRFPEVRDLYRQTNLPRNTSVATETAQPCVVTASLAGLHALESLGIRASVALGHSLGEITALYWAGACGKEDLLRLVSERGRIMAQMAAPSGSMASIQADHHEVRRRIQHSSLVIAAYNSRLQTVVSGETAAVLELVAELGAEGIGATILPVSHAFHSPLVADVASAFHGYLSGKRFARLSRRVVSTVTASVLKEDTNVQELLGNQITRPVQFAPALAIAATEADLLIEVGPGAVLRGIAAEGTDTPAVALNVNENSLRGLLLAAGAAFVLGTDIRASAFFESRLVRPFDLKRRHTFLQNPCEAVSESRAARHFPLGAALEPAESVTGADAIEILRNLVAQRTELPLATIKPDSRFLDHLHLNSITVSQIVLQAAARLNLPVPAAPTEYANVTLAEAARALLALRQQGPARTIVKFPRGVDSWIRVLGIEWIEQEPRSASPGNPGTWRVLALHEHASRDSLEREFLDVPSNGLVYMVPPHRDLKTAEFLLKCAQTALQPGIQHVVFVGSGVAALARTLYLENPRLKVTVVDVPTDHPQAPAWAAHEARSAAGFVEVQYDALGIRRVPGLQVLWPDEHAVRIPFGPEDVVLVTGGGKGITAECALALALESKCSLVLLGRSDPTNDQQLRENLSRFAESGVRVRYFAADIADATAVARAIQEGETEIGPVTVVLHGAGVNTPKRLESITAADLHDTLASKVNGLSNVLNSIDPGKLRFLVAFGSIIARTGLEGESHYGLANDWMAATVERWQEHHPECRCLNLQWSVWAGTGMGQRLGVLDSLVGKGIAPLFLEDSIRALKSMLAWKEAPVSSIITSRFGNLATLRFSDSDLPLYRFLEHVQVHYPAIELIADAELSVDTDPYVTEHVFQGEQLLPAVCGMEAMAQAAMALEKCVRVPQFKHLRFEHPIVIPSGKPVSIRVAALRRRPGRVSVRIRCSSTAFHVDHFSGECVFEPEHESGDASLAPTVNEFHDMPLDPQRHLYGRILFHQGRFQRIQKYDWLQADQSVAELCPPASLPWYALHLPAVFAAGDPSARDAALHSIQACIPHETILPVGIDRIVAAASWTYDRATVQAIERVRDGKNFLYDVTIRNADGQMCESWEGLRVRAVAPIKADQSWPLKLVPPYLERKVCELVACNTLKVALCDLRTDIEHYLRKLLGADARLVHRPDGKPEVLGPPNGQISLSHADRLTLLVLGNEPVGCDLEQILPRETAIWEDLLGAEDVGVARLVADRAGSPLDTAAAHVWTLKESLRKAGASFSQPIELESTMADNWITFSCGLFSAATFHAAIEEFNASFAFGFVIRKTQ